MATMTNVNFSFDSLLGIVLQCGEMNLKVMKMLNDAHVEQFGIRGIGDNAEEDLLADMKLSQVA